jgi:hypothetical protein
MILLRYRTESKYFFVFGGVAENITAATTAKPCCSLLVTVLQVTFFLVKSTV